MEDFSNLFREIMPDAQQAQLKTTHLEITKNRYLRYLEDGKPTSEAIESAVYDANQFTANYKFGETNE